MSKTIHINYDDAPVRLKDNDVLENTTIRAVGSNYGRFLFTEGITLLELRRDSENIQVNNCDFIGIGKGTAIHIL